GVVAVGAADEVALGEPVTEHGQQLLQQAHRRLVAAAPPLVLLLRAVQGDQNRQGPRSRREGEPHQDGQDDPLVPPAEGGVGVRRARRVARPRLAVDLLALVFGDRIVAGHGDGAGRQPAAQNVAGQGPAEPPQRATAAGEDAVVAGGMAGGEGVGGAQQVEDGAAAGGQDGRQEQDDKAFVGGAREGGGEGLQQGVGHAADRSGQRGRPSRASSARVWGVALLAALPRRASGSRELPSPAASGYSSHGSRWVGHQGV